jgi:hypothetical protein
VKNKHFLHIIQKYHVEFKLLINTIGRENAGILMQIFLLSNGYFYCYTFLGRGSRRPVHDGMRPMHIDREVKRNDTNNHKTLEMKETAKHASTRTSLLKIFFSLPSMISMNYFRSNQIKNGAPRNAVMAPTGISAGAIMVRAIRSARRRNIAPMRNDVGKTIR